MEQWQRRQQQQHERREEDSGHLSPILLLSLCSCSCITNISPTPRGAAAPHRRQSQKQQRQWLRNSPNDETPLLAAKKESTHQDKRGSTKEESSRLPPFINQTKSIAIPSARTSRKTETADTTMERTFSFEGKSGQPSPLSSSPVDGDSSPAAEEDCPICYEPLFSFGSEKIRVLSCNHTFHESCIEKWIIYHRPHSRAAVPPTPGAVVTSPGRRSRRCPICKEPF